MQGLKSEWENKTGKYYVKEKAKQQEAVLNKV